MQDSEFLLANKMFETKCKLYTKEMNPKPTHKSSIAAGDMLKLRGYFSEGIIKTRILDIIWPCLLIIMIMRLNCRIPCHLFASHRNNKSAYCVMPRSTKHSHTCK